MDTKLPVLPITNGITPEAIGNFRSTALSRCSAHEQALINTENEHPANLTAPDPYRTGSVGPRRITPCPTLLHPAHQPPHPYQTVAEQGFRSWDTVDTGRKQSKGSGFRSPSTCGWMKYRYRFRSRCARRGVTGSARVQPGPPRAFSVGFAPTRCNMSVGVQPHRPEQPVGVRAVEGQAHQVHGVDRDEVADLLGKPNVDEQSGGQSVGAMPVQQRSEPWTRRLHLPLLNRHRPRSHQRPRPSPEALPPARRLRLDHLPDLPAPGRDAARERRPTHSVLRSGKIHRKQG